jgi:hypothetical protein
MRIRVQATRTGSGPGPGTMPAARGAPPAWLRHRPSVPRDAKAGRRLETRALLVAPRAASPSAPALDIMVALARRVAIEAGPHAPRRGGLP